MILVMLNQRWMLKNATYKNLGKFICNKKKLANVYIIYIYIYIYRVNINDLYNHIWHQVFLFNTNDLYKILLGTKYSYQIFIIYTVIWFNITSGKGVVPFPTPWCSSYWKGNLRVNLNNGRQLYFFFTYLYTVIWYQGFPFNTNNSYSYMVQYNFFYIIIIIYLLTVIWFQVFLSNDNNVYTIIYAIRYSCLILIIHTFGLISLGKLWTCY